MQKIVATTVASIYNDIGAGIGISQRLPPRPMIVPHWLMPVLALHRLDVSVLKDPAQLQKHISHDMLVDLAAINRYVFNNSINLPTYMRSCHALFDIPGMEYLIDAEIVARKDQALDTIGLPDDAIAADQLYRIQDFDHEVFLIFVEPGFTTHLLRFRDKALAFVSECLRTQYKFASISTVAQTELYRIYLDLLTESSTVQ